MAKCGIEKYDDLPSRIGLIDVDYLRFRLSECNKPHSAFRKNRFVGLFLESVSESTKYSILATLEGAIKIVEIEKENRKRKSLNIS